MGSNFGGAGQSGSYRDQMLQGQGTPQQQQQFGDMGGNAGEQNAVNAAQNDFMNNTMMPAMAQGGGMNPAGMFGGGQNPFQQQVQQQYQQNIGNQQTQFGGGTMANDRFAAAQRQMPTPGMSGPAFNAGQMGNMQGQGIPSSMPAVMQRQMSGGMRPGSFGGAQSTPGLYGQGGQVNLAAMSPNSQIGQMAKQQGGAMKPSARPQGTTSGMMRRFR
jgi:hypothetical protein